MTARLFRAVLVAVLGCAAVAVAAQSAAAATAQRILLRPSAGGSLVYMRPDGSGRTTISHTAGAYQSALSPGGKRVAFVLGGGSAAELYVINTNGTGLRRLTKNSVTDGQPAWSPDGTKLAYYEDVPTSKNPRNYDIIVRSVATGHPHRLTTSPGYDMNPTWSPNGKKIAFLSDRAGYGCTDTSNGYFIIADQLYTMNADGTSQIRRVFGANDRNWADLGIAWGSRLAVARQPGYATDSGGNCAAPFGPIDIYATTRSAGLVNLTHDPDTATYSYSPVDFSWSPDGTRIAESVGYKVYILKADGSGTKHLLAAGDYPSWRLVG